MSGSFCIRDPSKGSILARQPFDGSCFSARCCCSAARLRHYQIDDDDVAVAVRLSHVHVLSSGSSRLPGCRRRLYWQYPPSTSSGGHSVHYRAQRGPRKNARPRHHHLNPPPPPAHRHPTCAQRLIANRKRDKNPPYGPLSPPDSASPTISLLLGVCCWTCPALGLKAGLFLRISPKGRRPISEAIALGPFPFPFPLFFSNFFFYQSFPISIRCLRSRWTDSHQLLASATASPARTI